MRGRRGCRGLLSCSRSTGDGSRPPPCPEPSWDRCLSAFAPQAAVSLGPPSLARLPPRTLPLWRLSQARQPPGPLVNPNVSAPTTHGPVLANPVTSVPTGRGKFGHRHPHTLVWTEAGTGGMQPLGTPGNQGMPRITGSHQELEEARKEPRPELPRESGPADNPIWTSGLRNQE